MKPIQSTIRLRVSSEMHAALQHAALVSRGSVSSVVRDAMAPYVQGTKTIPACPQNDKTTTCLVNADDWVLFQQLAKESNLSLDEAVRLIVKEYLDTFDHQTQLHTETQV